MLVENPSYLAALQSFGFAGARLEPVPCDEDGLDPEALPALIAEHAPKFLYVVPTFQNPTGRTLPAARRARLAQIAAEHGLWIVEDDPYGELRYDGEPLAPIGSHAGAADRTVTISSLSKVLAPGLRIGWLRAPAAILGPLTIAKQAADLHTSTVDQLAARTSLQAADLDLHIADLCREYRRRRDALLDGLADALPPGSTFNRPDGGMFVWARLPDGLGRRGAAARARWSTTSRSCRALRSSPASPTRARCACRSRPTCPTRSPRGWGGCGAAGRARRHERRRPRDVAIDGDMIRLGQLLKLAGLAESGGEARELVTEGVVRVNGEVETRRGRQLHRGDVVEVDGERVRVA